MSQLESCRINDVFGIEYGDKPGERLCRVMDVRDTQVHPLNPATYNRRPNVQRGRFLVTTQCANGQIRSFYAGAERKARKVSPIRRVFLYLSGKLPPRRVMA